MARSAHTAKEIYRFAREAGFDPGEATTMTAVALAESSGNPYAHNSSGENSQGLWQINAAAHPWAKGLNLFDPRVNAEAAYRVSQGGSDISPWTVTHGGPSARYLRYQEKAQAAAVAAGESPGMGNWSGVAGYGDRGAAGGVGGSGDSERVEQFLKLAVAQTGDEYVFGAEAKLSDRDPDSFDCSELTQWAAGRVGITMPDGSWEQYLQLKQQDHLISVEEAARTPGALLFRFSSEPTSGGGRPQQAHVAISLGDGTTIEAKGTKYGVGSFDVEGAGYQYAGVVPGLNGAGVDFDSAGLAAATFTDGTDTDGDGLTDELEKSLGLDHKSVDSDGDGFSDQHELLVTKTNATKADTDGDGVEDSTELALGYDPLKADSDLDGRMDALPGRPAPFTDADHDRLSDELEKILGTKTTTADHDGDGFTDGLEHRAGFDPLDPMSNPLAAPDPLAGAGLPGVGGAPAPGAYGSRPGADADADLDASVGS